MHQVKINSTYSPNHYVFQTSCFSHCLSGYFGHTVIVMYVKISRDLFYQLS